MSDFETIWNRESIEQQQRERLSQLGDLSKEDLIERIIALEVSLYPFVYAMGSLTEKISGTTTATSGLFPERGESKDIRVWNQDLLKFEEIDTPAYSQIHDVDYQKADSLEITDGTIFHDLFSILSVNQDFSVCSCSCGDITMGDVRHARKILYRED